MIDQLAVTVISDAGLAGAIALITLGALGVVWRSGVTMTDRFIKHLQDSEARDLAMREREYEARIHNTEVLSTLTHELREHDRRQTSLILGARPVGGSEEDLTDELPE